MAPGGARTAVAARHARADGADLPDLLLPDDPPAAAAAARARAPDQGDREERQRGDGRRSARQGRGDRRRRAHDRDRRDQERRAHPREDLAREGGVRDEGQEGRGVMSQFGWRIAGAVLTVVFFAFLTLANLVPEEKRVASPLLPDKGLRLGLDLQGGIHWVLGVKLEEAEAQELGFLAENLREIGDEKGDFHVQSSAVENGKLVARTAS